MYIYSVLSEKSYEYDRNGNQIRETDSATQETKSFTYDARNQMKGYQAKKDGTVVLVQEKRYNKDR